MKKSELSKYMSKLGKISRKVHPYTKEHYREMAYKSHEVRRRNKILSPGEEVAE